MARRDFQCIARKDKRIDGRPVYYVRFRLADGSLTGWRSSRQTAKVRAEAWAQRQLDEGKVGQAQVLLEPFLIDFWQPGKSSYLRQREAHGNTYSTVYLDANRAAIKNHFLPYFAKRKVARLDQLTRGNLEQWQSWCRLDKGVSARTCNRTRGAVWTALKWASEHELLPRHPGEAVKPLPEKTPERQIFEVAELRKLFNVAWIDLRSYAAVVLASCTGARLGECRGLTWENVREDTVDFVQSYVPVDGLKEGTKMHAEGRRDIMISPLAVSALAELREESPYTDPTDFVFYGNDRFEPCSRDVIADGLTAACDEAEIELDGRSFHCLRHSAISIYGPSMSPGMRLRYFGHSSVEISLRYSHETEADRKRLREEQTTILPFPEAK